MDLKFLMQSSAESLLRVAIIEDEVNSQELLTSIIEDYCHGMEVIGNARSITEGVKLLQTTPCDIVFMDIQLADGLSFEILQALDQWDFTIIFTTAYNQYALEAFKVEAVDYILKPYSPKQVLKAIDKVKRKLTSLPPLQIQNLFQTFSNHISNKVSFSTMEGITLIDREDIVHCTAEGAYCNVFVNDDDHILVSKNLSEIESKISSTAFVRVHASHLVNTAHIRKFLKEDGGCLVMSNGKQVPVSRRKKIEVMKLMEG